MLHTKAIFLSSLALFFSMAAYAGEPSSLHFTVKTLDGLSSLSGQVDFPDAQEKLPLVLMVQGTGLFDRNAEFGNSGTEEDLIFKALAKELNGLGFAVLRFDTRGVRCGITTMPVCENCKTPEERREHYFRSCFDNDARRMVTPETNREDILAVYRHGISLDRIDASRAIVFGHSEGSLNLSYLIKDNLIAPKAAVFMGGLAESPAGVIEWQVVGRFVDSMMEMDANQDGFVANEEIEASHSASRLNNFPLPYLLSPEGEGWSKATLQEWRDREYGAMKADALAKPDHEPFASGGLVQASYRWWKMFFTDSGNVIENLSRFKGPIVYCNGDMDAQTDFRRQKQMVEKAVGELGLNARIERFENVGHALGSDPIFGPMSPQSKLKLLSIFAELK